MVGVHRWLIEALGDEEAISQIEVDNYLPSEKFGQALERLRLQRFPTLPIWEGAKKVGRQVADAFLDGPNGQMISQSISVMPLDRALKAVVLPLSERMRKAAEFDWVPDADGKGGQIQVRGAFVVSWATLEGFFGGIIARIPGDHTINITEQTSSTLVFAVRPAGEATPPSPTGTKRVFPE